VRGRGLEGGILFVACAEKISITGTKGGPRAGIPGLAARGGGLEVRGAPGAGPEPRLGPELSPELDPELGLGVRVGPPKSVSKVTKKKVKNIQTSKNSSELLYLE
jgi:hypothetical protein